MASPDLSELDQEIDIEDIQVSEYIVFLMSLDTYKRYLEEAQQIESDQTLERGLNLLKAVDRRQKDAFEAFLNEKLELPAHKAMLAQAMRLPMTANNMARRALKLKMVLSRNKAMIKHVFGSNQKSIRAVREAFDAAGIQDADAALERLRVIPFLSNRRLGSWIKVAAETAGPGYAQNPVKASAQAASGSEELLTSKIVAQGEAQEDSSDSSLDHDIVLEQIQHNATKAAKEALEASGEPDEAPKKSEVVGIATAAVIEAMTDPENPRNIPEPLKTLDPEQRSAALSDGRVLVAAGAGAGKSTTLVSRVKYLIREKGVNPSKILVTSFNAKAAAELKQKIGTSAGAEALEQMSVGTMHGLFRRFITAYGTKSEKKAMGDSFVSGGDSVARAVNRIWAECYPEGTSAEKKVPSLKKAKLAVSGWRGDDKTPEQAKLEAKTEEEMDYALWYEMYEGLKGAIPGWKPPCGTSRSYESFMSRWRPKGERLGDFSDMVSFFLQILKRKPLVKKEIQKMYQHILVDECQDLDGVQNQIIELISEHIKPESRDSSIWLVGDDKQSLYEFRGARPKLFVDRSNNPDWKVRIIRTNYRCEPEIVEAANKLIANNSGQIPMEASPSPSKSRGAGSIKVEKPLDDADSAITAVRQIKQSIADGNDVSSHAILTRTNKEQHAFETACIISGIPYARSGASSFLGSPETKAFLSYVQLATGDDFVKMQKALGEVINQPNRFFMRDPSAAGKAVEQTLMQYARRIGKQLKDVSPLGALNDSRFVRELASNLTGGASGFKLDKAIESIEELQYELGQMSANTQNEGYKTTDLFNDILSLKGKASKYNPRTGKSDFVDVSFRDSLKTDLKEAPEDPDSDETPGDDIEDDKHSGLGNVSFLFELAKVDPTDEDDVSFDPGSPLGFRSKMERYSKKARDLRIDVDKWNKEQEDLPPEQRKAPPGVFLSTIHKVKGSQWQNVFVSMPKGVFPMEVRPKPGELPDFEKIEAEKLAERRLAYVALTRAAKNLTIMCPTSVGGRAAGVSPFVEEAGLVAGENIIKPGQTEPEEEETVKIASSPATPSRAFEDAFLYNISRNK